MQNINQMVSGDNEKQKLGYQYEETKPSPARAWENKIKEYI